jgi:hypothetical protein
MYYDKITIYGPGITYQYNNAGEINQQSCGGHSPELDPFRIYRVDDIRSQWQASFLGQWSDSKRGASNVLGRLQELIKGQLERLPDNPFVMCDAFLVGVSDVPGDRVVGWVKLADSIRAEVQKEQENETELNLKKIEAAKGIECKIVKMDRGTAGEEGRDPSALVEIRIDGGEPIRFNCRNIFDVGYVVNPAYSIAPGMEPGGLANKGQWETFNADKGGWYSVRDLTPDETRALAHLYLYPPVYDGIIM